MSRRWLTTLGGVFRSIGVVLVGFATLVIATTIVQESIFGGVSYRTSGIPTLIAAGILTPLAGVLSGIVTGGLARERPVIHTMPILIAIAVETTFLYRTGRVDGPLWFEALAGGALATAVLLGSVLISYWKRRPR